MKKLYIFSFLLILSVSNVFSQSGWFWQNPLPTSNTILKIKYFNNNFGMGVGDFGTVISTTDGGNLWLSIPNFTSINFKNLFIVDLLTIYIVGENGSIYKSTNSGFNWFEIYTGMNSQFNDVVFFNLNTGIVVGQGRILKTTNGGNNWVVNTVSTEINSVYFVNLNTGFLVGSSNTIYKTTNCGANWSIIIPEMYGFWNSVYFENENTGLLMGTNLILKTTSGGINWNISYTNLNNSYFTFDGYNSNIVYVGGSNGILLKTTDLGINWTQVSSGQGNKFISSIKVFDVNTLITLGWNSCYPCQYDIVYSSNNGLTWNTQIKGNRNHLNAIDSISNNTSITVGFDGTILRSTNTGVNWLTISSGTNYILQDVNMLSSGVGYICGGNSFGSFSIVLKTTNFGLEWSKILDTFGSYHALSFINELTGFVVGNYSGVPQAMKTTNGGMTFTNKMIGINTSILYDVQMIDQNEIYISGYDVFKTINGGDNWTNVLNTSYIKKALYFQNTNTGFVGAVNDMFKTTNGGLNWYSVYYNSGASIESIKFINNFTGWAVGYTYSNTRILKTVNGGDNWFYFNGITANHLNDFLIFNDSTLIAVGGEGTIIKTTNGGGNPIGIFSANEQIPQSFSLHQNYPNPFNPVTKIKFDIPNQTITKIIIFDLLGREVTTLVDEQLKPGSYSVDWDGTGFASGVYFYSLITDEFIETKRMVLVK